jgi:hypothetical protein
MASYLHGLLDFVATHPNFAFAAVFLLALSEAIPVVGTVSRDRASFSAYARSSPPPR